MAANTCNRPPFYGNGTGAVADYVFGFEYINRADVEVYVGEPGSFTQYTEGSAANSNEYQWQNDTTIRLNAVTGTDNVLITRETDRCAPQVEFFAGSSIRAEDLNDNQEQALFLAQEAMATLESIGVDQPAGSDGIELDDLTGIDISSPEDRSWLYFDGTNWVNGDVITGDDDWVASNTQIATTAAVNKRINDGGSSGGFHTHLVWEKDSSNENLYKATKIQITADGDPKKISETKIQDNILQVLIAAGVYDVSATIDSLNWDQKAEKFTVVIKNPSSEDKFIDEVISTLASVTRVESDLSKYTQDPASPEFGKGKTTTITYTVPDDKSFITPGSTTLAGGSAEATVEFNYNDDTKASESAKLTVSWKSAGSTLTFSFAEKTFLKMYEEINFSVGVTNLSDTKNASSALSSSVSGDKFFETNGTTEITAAKTGAFSGKIKFDPKLTKDSTTIGKMTKTTTFTRKKISTRTADDVTVEDKDESTPALKWTKPSFYLLTAQGTDPTAAACIDDSTTTGFKSNVTDLGLLGDKAQTNGTAGKEFEVSSKQLVWMAVSDDVDRPTKVETFDGKEWKAATPINVKEDIELKPSDTSGFPGTYTAEKYNFVGTILTTGKTKVRWLK